MIPKSLKNSGAGLLSDSYDLAPKHSTPQQSQSRAPSIRAPSVRATPKQPGDLRVRMSGQIKVDNSALCSASFYPKHGYTNAAWSIETGGRKGQRRL